MDTHSATVMIPAQQGQVVVIVNPGTDSVLADARIIRLQQGNINLVGSGKFDNLMMGFEWMF